jgi:hypothetical protein
MIGPFLALLLAAAPSTEAHTSAAPPSPLEAARETAARVQQLYDQSCGVRGYAAYDDICGPLADEIHRNRIAVDRLEREAARRPKPVSMAAPAPTTSESTGSLSSH